MDGCSMSTVEPIRGLYAAGNVMANPTGMVYGGAGATLAVAGIWGMYAGHRRRARRRAGQTGRLSCRAVRGRRADPIGQLRSSTGRSKPRRRAWYASRRNCLVRGV